MFATSRRKCRRSRDRWRSTRARSRLRRKWFEDAVATPYDTAFVECEGAKIHYQSWGDRTKPGLLLVHGNGAHAHWWDFVAPYLTDDYHVVAMTFSGMGDSDWRERYVMDVFAQEQLAVCEAAGLFAHAEKPIIVAHSFGGFVTILTGAEYGDRFGGIVIVDSPVNPPDRPRSGPPPVRGGKVYPTLEAALARFRLAPPQPCENHYIMDYIARWSLAKKPRWPDGDGDGWGWKFDPSIWQRFSVSRPPQELLKADALPDRAVQGREVDPLGRRCRRLHARPAEPAGAVHRDPRSAPSCDARPAAGLRRGLAHAAAGVALFDVRPGHPASIAPRAPKGA